ncbi:MULTISPECIES: hypothetical protein [Rhizobium]|uniref:hypothetical protein n=1 Tax=Rhizobium TaxID=379 RepID=UPI0003FA83FA|nr:hypothetical protein [Rhizobium favelukesii]
MPDATVVPGFSDLAPTGAATALIGGPLLLFLLPRVHGPSAITAKSPGALRRVSRPSLALLLFCALFLAMLAAVLPVGPTDGGW